MLLLISPAKTLDFERTPPPYSTTTPDFLHDASVLIDVLRDYDVEGIAKLMRLSPSLAALNTDRYASWTPNLDQDAVRPAVFAFRGDVYQGLDVDHLDDAAITWAQSHLRILSGLYGLLRPLDVIRPYRLEMGTRLRVGPHRHLYEFWGDRITRAINTHLTGAEEPVVVNLASDEYFGAVQPSALDARLVTPIFREYRDGEYRFISMFGKRARGLMARWASLNRPNHVDELKSFDLDGYRYEPGLSTPDRWMFVRAAG
ncbi:MAG: peroxide stress protein YaaA [Pseudomonadales bacterium]